MSRGRATPRTVFRTALTATAALSLFLPVASAKSVSIPIGAGAYAGAANLHRWEAYAKSHPRDPNAQLQAGIAAFQNGEPRTAIAYYQAALRDDPHDGAAANAIGNVYRERLNDPRRALTYYLLATRIEPSYDYGWYNAVAVMLALKEHSAAVALEKKAMKALSQDDVLRPYIAELVYGKKAALPSGRAVTVPIPARWRSTPILAMVASFTAGKRLVAHETLVPGYAMGGTIHVPVPSLRPGTYRVVVVAEYATGKYFTAGPVRVTVPKATKRAKAGAGRTARRKAPAANAPREGRAGR